MIYKRWHFNLYEQDYYHIWELENKKDLKIYKFIEYPHPGSGSDRTIASERQSTALATIYIRE